MNILLHICCAPCAIYPVDRLGKDGHAPAGFFYNPNIHPYSEYLRREDEARRYAKPIGLNVVSGGYDIERYFQNVVYKESAKDRCPVCWWLRIAAAAKFAKENGFEAFTTTLLGSPYQDHEIVKTICEEVAEKAGVAFHYKDFRAGFKDAHETAKREGIYCQNYCGCVFSEKERIEKKVQGRGVRAKSQAAAKMRDA